LHYAPDTASVTKAASITITGNSELLRCTQRHPVYWTVAFIQQMLYTSVETEKIWRKGNEVLCLARHTASLRACTQVDLGPEA